MAKTIQVLPEEQFAREYADRLILGEIAHLQSVIKLSEVADRLQSIGLGLLEVRALLASNPNKFAYSERRWVPASRVESEGRPALERVRLCVAGYGAPMPFTFVQNELNLSGQFVSEDKLRRLLNQSTESFVTSNNLVVIRQFCFAASGDIQATAYGTHRVTEEHVLALVKKLEGTNFRQHGAIEEGLGKVGEVNAILYGAAVWTILNGSDARNPRHYDWKKFYNELFSLEGFVMAANGNIAPIGEAKKWIAAAVKLADKLAPTVEIDDVAPIEVNEEFIGKLVNRILKSEDSVTATKLLEEFYEITPSVKTFPDDIANMMSALNASEKVLWVGGDRFNKPNVVPELVENVPSIFEYPPTEFVDAEGELIDVELTDDGLSSSLRKLLNHPLATDVMDEEFQPLLKQQPESLRLVLKPLHRELGTFPMCQFPTGWLDNIPKYQELILIDKDLREIQVWVNTEARLMFGFIDWFFEQPVESGSVFSLTKTNKPNVLEFAWLDQSDPVVFITNQRMEELRNLQTRSEELSTFDILREVMSHWPKGADFLTVLWEVNVVRRSSRRLIASLLSSYACFYQRSGSPVWHYDNKKVEQGFDKSKRKFVKK